MSNQDSLLGFLKKKSLFNQSPVRYPAGKRSRSKSKDGKESIIRKLNGRQLEDDHSPIDKLNKNFSIPEINKESPKRGIFQKEYQPSYQNSFQDNNYRKDNANFMQPQQNSLKLKQSSQNLNFNTNDKGNKFLTGLVSYSSSFESARVQSAQCLETLSLKLSTQISNVNYRVDQFRTNMSKVLNNQLKALREQILHLVDEAFQESERSIREYMRIEQQKLAQDLFKIREILEKEYVRVETMKEEIAQPQWRKVAGEILATELQKNLQEIVKKSSNTNIGKWEMKNLSGQRLKTLENQLRDLVRLKE